MRLLFTHTLCSVGISVSNCTALLLLFGIPHAHLLSYCSSIYPLLILLSPSLPLFLLLALHHSSLCVPSSHPPLLSPLFFSLSLSPFPSLLPIYHWKPFPRLVFFLSPAPIPGWLFHKTRLFKQSREGTVWWPAPPHRTAQHHKQQPPPLSFTHLLALRHSLPPLPHYHGDQAFTCLNIHRLSVWWTCM